MQPSLDLLDIVFLHRTKRDAPVPAPTQQAVSMDESKPTPDPTSCPVDHKARQAWLARTSTHDSTSSSPSPTEPPTNPPTSWTQTLYSYLSPSSPVSKPIDPPRATPHPSLNRNRVISSIPRSSDPGPTACPVNHERETGKDATTGNWIYPSEKMFFDAMRRKGHAAQVADMRTIVPIHNAVNERAWREISEWEGPYVKSTGCNGPRLHSFAGQSERMTPKARLNTILGYTAPFDRHDWVVDRCGTKIEYVIDFYAGRDNGSGSPSFYLDVRPKLNSWEGVKMRVLRGLALA